MRTERFIRYAILFSFASLGIGVVAQQPPAGVYTAEQAQSGQALYTANCASCHGPDLNGGGAPALAGQAFLGSWRGKPASELFTFIETQMPPGGNPSLTRDHFTQIVAFILQQNNVPAGAESLRADSTAPIVPGARGAQSAPASQAA